MKKVVLSIVFLTAVGVYAQSFKLYEVVEDGETLIERDEVADGDTLSRICTAVVVDNVLSAFGETFLNVENTSDLEKVVVCKREFLSMIDSASTYFCWSTCLEKYVSIYEYTMGAHEKTPVLFFSSHYAAPLKVVGSSFIRYTFYDKSNPDDAISVVFEYITPPDLHTPIYGNPLVLSVYPNPTKERLTIDNEQSLIETVELYDIYGKKLSTFVADASLISIEVPHLSAGVYYLQFIKDSKVVGTRKFIKE
jgi:hypothetical protein